jgi:hypothetical protein
VPKYCKEKKKDLCKKFKNYTNINYTVKRTNTTYQRILSFSRNVRAEDKTEQIIRQSIRMEEAHMMAIQCHFSRPGMLVPVGRQHCRPKNNEFAGVLGDKIYKKIYKNKIFLKITVFNCNKVLYGWIWIS